MVDLVGIAVFGWLYGLVLAGIGVMIAAMTTFFIARYFREPLLRRFVSLQKIHIWESQFSEKEKFWHLVWLRIITGPFFDYLSYAAGLSKMKAGTYFWSTFFGALPLGFIIYYFGNTSFTKGPIGIAIFLISATIVALILKNIAQKELTSAEKESLT